MSARGRAPADAQGRCDGDWLQRNRLTTTLWHTLHRVSEGCFGFGPAPAPPACSSCRHITHHAEAKIKSPISLVKSPSGGLGLKTRKPPGCFCRALRIPFSFLCRWDTGRAYTSEYPIPSRTHSSDTFPPGKPTRNRRQQRPKSGKTISTHYTTLKTQSSPTAP